MAEGRMRHAWNHTSSIMALIANVNRDPKRKPSPFKAEEFNPYATRKKKGIPLTKETWAGLKAAFVK